jgi:copper chaperone
MSVGARTTFTSTYTVKGMNCGHCVASVTEELTGLTGVSDVAVTLETGAVSVTSDRALDRAKVAEAITEAGFTLVD